MSSPVYIGLDTHKPHALFNPPPKNKLNSNAKFNHSNSNANHKPKFSPLMDPILLESKTVQKLSQPSFLSKIWEKLTHLNMYNLMVNIIIPLTVFLFLAFQLKSKYYTKREEEDDEFFILENEL